MDKLTVCVIDGNDCKQYFDWESIYIIVKELDALLVFLLSYFQ